MEAKEIEIAHRIRDIQDVRIELSDLRNSNSWQMILKLQRFRERIVPKKSNRERWMYRLLRVWRAWRRDGLVAVFRRIIYEVKYRSHTAFLRLRYRSRLATRELEVNSFSRKLSVTPHTKSVDILICVHNALDDVRNCLESVLQYTTQPYTLIVVDDGSNLETETYLQKFADSQGIILLRNETASGYTLAANKGLIASKGDYVVLLNSDTIVSTGWLDRMVACGESDEKIGVVGPLSNAASWQSVPETLTGDGDWVDNPLPDGLTISTFSGYVSRYAGCLYPRLPFLNGFCLVIKRKLIEQIGFFDEQTFGAGYGEENDFCIRARKAGWELVVSDDVYIHHAQSKSYSHERRGHLAKNADVALVAKHGQQIISDGVKICRFSPVMLGIRARNRAALVRERLIVDGLRHWEGKRVLFLLPLTSAGGGGHVIIQEAKAMRKMGVDVRFMNLRGAQAIFEASFPENDIPIIYLEEPRLNKSILTIFDAIVASVFHSVEWLDPILPGTDRPLKGYYIQDFEPRFFTPGTKDYDKARASYSLYPDLILFSKTEWNCEQVRQLSGMDCQAIGPSLDIDLFRPRPKADLEWPNRPLRVSAMIRPSTPRRQAKFTMEVLRNFKENNKNSVEVLLFGCESNDPEFQVLSKDFSWKHAGVLTRSQLSSLLNEVDIFVDFSSFQAMGLTAMEAMACGAAVILPREGGANSFAVHEVNALIVDTHSKHRCLSALERLHNDHDLRIRLQRQAIADICKYPPELAAYNILMRIFGG